PDTAIANGSGYRGSPAAPPRASGSSPREDRPGVPRRVAVHRDVARCRAGSGRAGPTLWRSVGVGADRLIAIAGPQRPPHLVLDAALDPPDGPVGEADVDPPGVV